jgi:carbon-monoxide dehydrogenase medium subunit
MKRFDYHRPETLKQAISLLVAYKGQAKVLAGGTDLILAMRKESVSPRALIDLKDITELHSIKEEEKVLRIGALTTIREIETLPLIKERICLLAETAEVMATLQVRNRATLGGNICHASPAADMVPPLIGLEGRVRIAGKDDERMAGLEDFFLGPGQTKLGPEEIVTEVIVPKLDPNSRATYIKLGPRKLTDLAVVGVALILRIDRQSRCDDIRIVMGAVAPRAMRAREAERKLVGRIVDERLISEVAEKAREEAFPITDVRGSEWYRREMVKVLVERGLRKLSIFGM